MLTTAGDWGTPMPRSRSIRFNTGLWTNLTVASGLEHESQRARTNTQRGVRRAKTPKRTGISTRWNV